MAAILTAAVLCLQPFPAPKRMPPDAPPAWAAGQPNVQGPALDIVLQLGLAIQKLREFAISLANMGAHGERGAAATADTLVYVRDATKNVKEATDGLSPDRFAFFYAAGLSLGIIGSELLKYVFRFAWERVFGKPPQKE